MSSKNLSTDATVSVSAPKSISSAPNDTIPSGTLIKPYIKPAPNALYQLVLLSASAELNGINSAIYCPMLQNHQMEYL